MTWTPDHPLRCSWSDSPPSGTACAWASWPPWTNASAWPVCCRWLSCGALRVDVEHGLTDAGHPDQHGAMSADDGHGLFYLVALVSGEFVEAGVDSCDEAADPGDLFG